MYYDNKRTFYVKQYGPAVLVSVIAVALISVGSALYLRQNNSSDDMLASADPIVQPVVSPVKEDTEALKEVEVVPYFENLNSLVISEEVNVASADNNGNISLEYNGDKITIAMIGIDYSYSGAEVFNKIRTDLEGKTVKIAFDKQRNVNGVNYAYVYKNNELYNAAILRSGLATLKSERVNVALATDLSKAQAYARDNKLGVWNK